MAHSFEGKAHIALVETTVAIDYLRRRAEALAYLDGLRSEEVLRTSVVTAAELLSGCRDKREEHEVRQFLNTFDLEPITEADSWLALRLLEEHRLKDGLGWLDCPIASIALRLNVPIATLNVKHFRPIVGLPVVRPY